MFISELEKEESLWNVMSEIYKNRNAKKKKRKKQVSKDCLNYFRDSISIILKE